MKTFQKIGNIYLERQGKHQSKQWWCLLGEEVVNTLSGMVMWTGDVRVLFTSCFEKFKKLFFPRGGFYVAQAGLEFLGIRDPTALASWVAGTTSVDHST